MPQLHSQRMQAVGCQVSSLTSIASVVGSLEELTPAAPAALAVHEFWETDLERVEAMHAFVRLHALMAAGHLSDP